MHRLTLLESHSKEYEQSRVNNLLKALEEKALITLLVEPCSYCNLKCTFCDLHSGRLTNAGQFKGKMTQEIYDLLIAQLSGIGFRLKQLQFHGNGEPLMHERLVDFVQTAKNKDVAESIRITTNGAYLTLNKLRALIKAGADDIRISIDAVGGDYDKLKGGSYSRLKLNVIAAIKEFAVNPECRLYLKYAYVASTGDDYGFSGKSQSVLKEFQTYISSNNVQFVGMPILRMMDGLASSEKSNVPCELPFYSLFVKFDGRVSVCCADSTNMMDLGTIQDDGLASVLYGSKLRLFRQRHIQKELHYYPLCMSCTQRTCVNVEKISQQIQRLL